MRSLRYCGLPGAGAEVEEEELRILRMTYRVRGIGERGSENACRNRKDGADGACMGRILAHLLKLHTRTTRLRGAAKAAFMIEC